MKTTINVKVDKEVKEKVTKVIQELGYNTSIVVNAFLKQVIRDRSIPSMSLEPQLKPEVEKHIEQAEEDYKKGRNISPVFSSAKEMSKYLRSL